LSGISRSGWQACRTVAARKSRKEIRNPMRDIVIGIAFLAMLLSPALVASFNKKKNDDEA